LNFTKVRSKLSDVPRTTTRRPLPADDVIPIKGPVRRTESEIEAEMTVPARKVGGAPIVQAGSVTGRSLTLVIAIMCFLACLTAGAVYMINQSAAAWLRNIASEVSVQIDPRPSVEETDSTVTAVTDFLKNIPGVAAATAISTEASAALLEPWLGKSEALNELPIPRLIALEINRQTPPDLERVRVDLEKQFPGVTLDDHRHWQSQIRTVTRSLAVAGLAILALVAAATTAIIISATRSAMASNREIVEVLHFVGATDRFIAREFEKHFLTLGVRAGLVGAGSAALVFLIVPWIVPWLGGGVVAEAEMRNLVGGGWLDLPGFALLGIVVVVVAALCMLTSRYGVFRILHLKD
jgi:cell division transport system permease protein